MSQHDMVIADQPGASFLADLNSMIAALVTNSSGATEPATTYAYQLWADSTAGLLKQRNAANDGWVTVWNLTTGAPGSGVAAGPITASGLTQATARLLGRTTAGTGAIEEISVGAGLSMDSGSIDLARPFTAGTAVATTSGTAIDFTGIPAWVKRITVMFNGVSTNGTSAVRVRIGPVAGVESSGYLGSSGVTLSASAAAINFTAGFDFADSGASTAVRHGSVVLTLLDSTSNTWAISGVMGQSDVARAASIGGIKPLAGALSVIRLTTVNGTDTFDAGSINILYE